MTIWTSDGRSGASRQITTLLKRFERPIPSRSENSDGRTWLDAGQRATLSALQCRLCETGLPGAIIADEVGMGKTRIAVALACAVTRAGGRVVVAVPPGLLHQWRDEFRQTFQAAREEPPEIPEIRSLRDLYSHDLSPSPKTAPVLLLPHGLLNFQMKNGWGSQWLLTQYQDRIAGRVAFSRLIPKDEREIIRHHVGRLAKGDALRPEELQSRGTGREAFISFTLSLLGAFDLVIIDEAHKSKNDAATAQEKGRRSTLAQLLMRLVRQNGTHKAPPRRLCLTATPFELHADNWRLILQRAGAPEDKADACAQASEQFLAAAKSVRLLPSWENATAFKSAADEFYRQLSPWMMRRRKAVAGNDSVLERYIRDHGPNYRDRSQKITAQVTGKDWSIALMAVEALSLMPDTGLGAQKRLRLALARGFSLATALDATGKPEKGDWQEYEEQTFSDTDQGLIRNQQEQRRRERAGFWLGRLKQAAADPYAHPTLLAAVRAIEEITTHSASPEKVLVFGIFTQAMRRLTVTSRVIVRAFPEELRLLTIPFLEGFDGCSSLEDGLRQLAVVEVDVAQDGLLQVVAALEPMALKNILDATVESLDHAVCLRPHRGCEAVLDAELGAEQVELVLSGSGAFAQAEQPVGEGLSVVGEHPGDLHRGRALQIAQEAARVGRGLRRIDAHEDPARRAVDGYEEISAPILVGHLGQVFHVDMQVAGLICLEGPVRGLRLFRLQRPQIARPMATQAAVQTGSRDMRVEELAHHGQQIVEWQEQCLAQHDRDGFLSRSQRRLQPVWRVAPVVDVVPITPLPDSLLGDPVALGHHPRRVRARLDRGPDLRRGRCLLVQGNQHVRTPSRTSRRIDLAMNRAERRGSM